MKADNNVVSKPATASAHACRSATLGRGGAPQYTTIVTIGLAILATICMPSTAYAQDPENCLSCHRFRGLSRLEPETGELRLFFCSAEYYAHRQGAHARLRCTACHARDEVEVIPHKVKTRVDCTQECHITPAATGAQLRFSHQRVEDSLMRSAHSPEHFAKLHFDPPLLREGQSQCLYCHDQPTFGFAHGVPEGFIDHSGGTRCDTCHEEALPLEIEYFANHVAARMKPARPVRQLVQVCAVCHSSTQHAELFHQHDAVASYLHSFHGKASLLGSKETATCIECHSSPDGDQHLMLAKTEPGSSIHPEQLPDTCRTTACHPGFPPEVSSAAVHFELDPAKHTPEYYVAVFFILMTAGVMALFFLLVVLELFNAVVRRGDPEHHRLERLARAIQAHPEGRKLVERMSVHERWQHWVLAISFTILVVTGMPIKFAEAEWSQTVIWLFGNLTVARVIHRIAGVILLGVFAYHLGYLFVQLVQQIRANRREGRRESILMTVYNAPMMMRPSDAREFLMLFGYLVGLRKERPRFGRYNVLEKFEYWAVFWGMPVMGLSGLALWAAPWVAENMSGRTLNFAFIIHSDEAYLAFIYVAAIHLFSVIFAPTVFPLSRGTLTGQAPPSELVEGHRGDLEEIAKRLNIQVPVESQASCPLMSRVMGWIRQILMRIYSAGAMAGYAAIAFISLRFLIMMLVTRETAPVEIVDIPTRLDAQTFFAAAASPDMFQMDPEHPVRGPLAHFHQIPQWFQPDPKDTCTTSGCHLPLPHGNRIEVRAFLNMHATFVDCGACHAQDISPQDDAQWVSLPGREPMGTPAILQLATRLETLGEVPSEEAAVVSAELQGLLREALPASGNNPQLADWLLRLETTHPRSQLWRDLVAEIRREIQMHVRGEYAAKLAMFSGVRRVGAPSPEQQAATREYVQRADELPEAARQELLDTVHTGIRPVGAMCTPCHSAEPTLLDIAELGYPPSRVERLRNSPIMRSVLQIESGQPFYLPLDQQSDVEGLNP